jgi:hypothetical protein
VRWKGRGASEMEREWGKKTICRKDNEKEADLNK